MSPIHRPSLSLTADAAGHVEPAVIALGAFDATDYHDGATPAGVILLALVTRVRGADHPIDCFLFDEHGQDVFYDLGRQRSHTREQKTVLHTHRRDEHALIYPGETLRLEIPGRHRAGAEITFALYYADALPPEDEDDGRKYH